MLKKTALFVYDGFHVSLIKVVISRTCLEPLVLSGVVYTLDRVLLPNPLSILQLLKGKKEFSRFLQLLEFARMSEEVGEDAEKDGQTLLVPTNAAFDKLEEEVNSRLLADQAFAQKVVQRHILDEV